MTLIWGRGHCLCPDSKTVIMALSMWWLIKSEARSVSARITASVSVALRAHREHKTSKAPSALPDIYFPNEIQLGLIWWTIKIKSHNWLHSINPIWPNSTPVFIANSLCKWKKNPNTSYRLITDRWRIVFVRRLIYQEPYISTLRHMILDQWWSHCNEWVIWKLIFNIFCGIWQCFREGKRSFTENTVCWI